MTNNTTTPPLNCLSLEQLSDVINQNFAPPFLQEGLVSAELEQDSEGGNLLNISIGRRDVSINSSGEVVGCGTFLGNASLSDVDDDRIPNWQIFGTHLATISLVKTLFNDGEVFYNSIVNFSLDNGVNESFDSVVALITDQWDEDPVICALQTATNICSLFDTSYYVLINDEEGECLGEFYLPDDIDFADSSNTDITWFNVDDSVCDSTVESDDEDFGVVFKNSKKIIIH